MGVVMVLLCALHVCTYPRNSAAAVITSRFVLSPYHPPATCMLHQALQSCDCVHHCAAAVSWVVPHQGCRVCCSQTHPRCTLCWLRFLRCLVVYPIDKYGTPVLHVAASNSHLTAYRRAYCRRRCSALQHSCCHIRCAQVVYACRSP
jgi:hypothetical protein